MAVGGKINLGRVLTVEPSRGRMEIRHLGLFIRGLTAEARYRVQGKEKTLGLRGDVAYGVGEDRVSLSTKNEDLELTWQASVKKGVCLQLRLLNVGQRPLEVFELSPFLLSRDQGGLNLGSPKGWSFYQNGWQSWSPSFVRHLDNGHYVTPGTEEYRLQHEPYPLPLAPKTLVSHGMTVLHNRTSKLSLLLGFTSAREQMAEIRLEVEGLLFRRLAATAYADGVRLHPGERISSEELLVRGGRDPLSLLEGYAQALGENMGARKAKEIPTGWCSWYYFYGENGARETLANAKGAGDLSLDYCLIDDGHQKEIGDWLVTDGGKFPQGMKRVGEEIRASTRKAGLWIAPFAASSRSRLYKEHPDWVLRDEGGEPVVAWHHRAVPIYALDLTHPEVKRWLKELFRILSDDWGYDLFKIDFLYAGALEGRRYDPQVTRAQAFRQGLEIIREAVDDKFLLGCGAPWGPAVGLVDGMRIGPDVAVHWRPLWGDLSSPSARNALRNVMARYFMHGWLWTNDPDCVLVRPRGEESNLKLNEMRTLISIVGLAGGSVFSGDDLPSLGRGRRKYLKRILPPYGRAAKPCDLFEKELPSIFALPIEAEYGRWMVAAFINWADRMVETEIDFDQVGLKSTRSYHVYDFWSRRYLGVFQGRLTIARHGPHQTVLLLFKEATSRPQFLTSTFHITQGGVEVRAVEWRDGRRRQSRFILELVKPGSQFGELLFAVPEPYRAVNARVNGQRRGVRKVAPGVVGLGFTLKDQAQVELHLRRV